jgi:FAD-linked oxidoreductase
MAITQSAKAPTSTSGWSNWSGSVQSRPAEYRSPTDEAAIITLIDEARLRGVNLRVVGAGHSFTPLVATDGMLISLDQVAGLESFDQQQLLATVRAGTRIKALGEILHANGVAQENLGDIDVQSIAGALATGTHGTGITFGSLATQIAKLRLVTAGGEVLECSEEHNREIFKAAQVSLGALGIVSSVTLRVVPSFRLHYTWQPGRLADLLPNLVAERERNRNFEFYWVPHTDAVLLKRMNITDAPADRRSIMRELNDLLLENGAFWVLCELGRRMPKLTPRLAGVIGSLIGSGQATNDSHKIYATTRLVRFNEMEYSLPAEQLGDTLAEIQRTVARERIEVLFPLECRYVRGDNIPLSPAYGRDSCYIAVHQYRGMPYRGYFATIEAIFRRRGGRPHWGKIHTRTSRELQELYPEWDRFMAARRALDPEGRFLNAYLQQLFGVA